MYVKRLIEWHSEYMKGLFACQFCGHEEGELIFSMGESFDKDLREGKCRECGKSNEDESKLKAGVTIEDLVEVRDAMDRAMQ